MAGVEVEVPAEVVADGWLCGEDVVTRDGLHWHGSHGRQSLELNESTKLLYDGKEAGFEDRYL